MIAAEILIAIGYFWFAVQVGAFSFDKKNPAQRTFAALALVFVACAFNGYLVPAIQAATGDPGWLKEAHFWTHWALVVATYWLVLSNGALLIKKALADHGRDI